MAVSKGDKITLEIVSLGSNGDGVAYHGNVKVFVTKTAPGDKVEAVIQSVKSKEARATVQALYQASDLRIEPECPYYSECGGCSLQHVSIEAYQSFKQDVVLSIVKKLDLNHSTILPLVSVGYGERRRVDFKVSSGKSGVGVGFYGSKTHQVISIEQCLIGSKAINDIIDPLQEVLSQLKKPAHIKNISITEVELGLDMLIAADMRLKERDISLLKEFAKSHSRVLRMVLMNHEANNIMMQHHNQPVSLHFDDIPVSLPVGSFLQATQSGQEAITSFIKKHIPDDSSRVADIYSGCGTYTIPLGLLGHIVYAYEGSEDMIMALHNAVSQHQLANHVNAEVRDLVINPISTKSLNQFDVVIINPPRQGAMQQVKQLVKSQVKTVILVSCNPKTFEKDLKLLLSHDYQLVEMQGIDQFYQSYHLEIVAVLQKV